MDKYAFIEKYFKFITLCFWPIIWYKWVFISSGTFELNLFLAFSLISVIYLIYFIYIYLKSDISKRRTLMLSYHLSSIAIFIVTILSFVLYPKNIFLLYLKFFILFIYFYSSYYEVYKRKNEEGVVGIMSGLLLLVFTIFY